LLNDERHEQQEAATSGEAIGGPEEAVRSLEAVRDHLRAAIVGRDDVIELVLVALTAGGHVLLEDYPGSGKTLLARALGESLVTLSPEDGTQTPFRRIQFTPDLLPSDITGVSVFDPDRGSFDFRPGPVFAHVLLADEINRTSPKVQAALLEAMAERQVTVDNVTHPLREPFVVLATQNPLGLAGTFPLPAPQLDRFLFKIQMVPIARDAELEVVASFRQRLHHQPAEAPRVEPSEIVAARCTIEQAIHVAPVLQAALVDVARAIRADERIAQGVSTRALVQAIPALQARAALRGRDFVSSDDLDALLEPLFAHRIALAPGATEPERIVREAARSPLESLTRSTLRR
jgi:MoxR-like ATPase